MILDSSRRVAAGMTEQDAALVRIFSSVEYTENPS